MFETKTKRDPDPARGLEGLAEAVKIAGDVPVVAIGGIGPEHAEDIAGTGAVAACCVSAVNHVRDRAAAGARVGAAFGSSPVLRSTR